jgi:hypothetical protein
VINHCVRCGEHEELRRGSVTGERIATYVKLRKKVNESGILTLSPKRGTVNLLCLQCLEELAEWIKNKNKRVR